MTASTHARDDDWRATDVALDRALDLGGSERQRFLDSLPVDRRQRVEALLEAAEIGGPLDHDLGAVAGRLLESTGDQLEPSIAGRRIGSWRMLERLGAGGMGVVHLAERADDAYHHRVALKVIRWELATPGLVERFVAERQILAQLSHPHIATLIDGGMTADGLPFLVLEYVEGRPVDRYCDDEGLDLDERVRLMATVCRAVDFAHRQLVVHRDLKPSNILIRPDGVPKLVDFGVAKLLDPAAGPDEPTRFTAMTPRYAAPEQRRGEPASVAADVWGLGIVLAEVLTGSHPIPDPNAGPGAEPDLSAFRRDRRLRGDLANIVCQALRPEPEQRYRSAGALADDLFRCLDGLPVEATRPTFGYRLGKLIGRHRVATAAILVAHVVAAAGLGGMIWQAREARQERDMARQRALEAEQAMTFLTGLFQSAVPRLGGEPSVRDLLDEGADRIRSEVEGVPTVRVRLLSTLGASYKWLRDFDRAEELLSEAVTLIEDARPGTEEHGLTVSSWGGVALHRGDLDAAEHRFRRALRIFEAADLVGSTSWATTLNSLGMTELGRKDPQAAERWLRKAVDRSTDVGTTELAAIRANLAKALEDLGRVKEAEAEHRAALATYREADPTNSTIATILNNLALNLALQGRLDEAIAAIEESVALRNTLSVVGPDVAEAEANLAYLLLVAGRSEQALELVRPAAEILDEITPDTTNAIATRANLGWALTLQRQHDQALPILRQVVSDLARRFGPDHQMTARGHTLHGAALLRFGRLDEARRELEVAHAIMTDAAPSAVSQSDLDVALGAVWCDTGRAVEGLEAVERALATRTRLYGADHWQSAHAELERARCLAALSQPWDRATVATAIARLNEVRGPAAWSTRRGQELMASSASLQ